MDIQEFYNEFNLVYNNLASNQAPGLDKYEISVYLTKAEELYVDTLYAEFEKSEDARRKLTPIVVTAKRNPIAIASDKIIYPDYTTTYEPLDDVRYIINEQVVLGNTNDRCTRNLRLKVQPILHDEIDRVVNNPYKFNNRRALRLDTDNYIEILTKAKPVSYYQIRYVKNPDPIILDDFDEEINGINHTTLEGSLPKETHRKIVEIAAKMAYSDYKQ